MEEKKQLTIDEWFYHWLADENKYLLAAKFLLKILEVCDKIVLQKDTRLARKFYLLDQESGKWPPQQREVVRIVKNQFLQNLLKIHWVEETSEFTEEIEAGLPRKDVYLVKICYSTTHKILITTDVTLRQNLSDLQEQLQITPHFAEEFIQQYLNQ